MCENLIYQQILTAHESARLFSKHLLVSLIATDTTSIVLTHNNAMLMTLRGIERNNYLLLDIAIEKASPIFEDSANHTESQSIFMAYHEMK